MTDNTPLWLQNHQADELLRKKRQGVITWDEGEQEWTQGYAKGREGDAAHDVD